MRIYEKIWGIIYLFSGIFVIIISIWKFPIFYLKTRLVLFSSYIILMFILELIFSCIFIGLSRKSFKYARKGLDEDESTSILSKIVVLLSNIYQVYMILETMNYIILYW